MLACAWWPLEGKNTRVNARATAIGALPALVRGDGIEAGGLDHASSPSQHTVPFTGSPLLNYGVNYMCTTSTWNTKVSAWALGRTCEISDE